MRILRILFLGIVLVTLNLAYLHAYLPDTVSFSGGSVEPGDTVDLTMDISIHSTGAGGFAISIEGIPSQFDTAAGAWYTLTPMGQALSDNASLGGFFTLDLEAGVLNWTVLGANIDQLVQFGIIPSKSGQLATFHFIVPADMPEGTIAIDSVNEGSQMMRNPATLGPFAEPPVVLTQPINVFNIPDNNTLLLPDTVAAPAGGTISLPITLANRDSVASGSFQITFPDYLTLTGATAGPRGTGMTFDIASSMLAAVTQTVTFAGGNLGPGTGQLVNLNFTVASSIPGGVAETISIPTVTMNSPAGAPLADVVAPTTGPAQVDVSYSDSLVLAVQAGSHTPGTVASDAIAQIVDGKLRVPVTAEEQPAGVCHGVLRH